MWKNTNATICKWKNITQTGIREKIPLKKRLKAYVLIENNQPIMHAKPKEKKHQLNSLS